MKMAHATGKLLDLSFQKVWVRCKNGTGLIYMGIFSKDFRIAKGL